MVFVELTTDAFADTFDKKRKEAEAVQRAGADRVRRPLRGLEIKDDTYAIIKVVRADGSEIRLADSGSPDGLNTQFSNFILQNVTEARMEKHQIVETFGDPYIYFFGESPRFLDVQAILVDSNDFNWYAEFWDNYNRYFRGTRSVEMGARVYLFYDDNIVEGYMLMAQARKVADQPLQAALTFRLYLTNYSNVRFVGGDAGADPNFPVRKTVSLPPDVTLTAADAFSGGRSSGKFADFKSQYEAAVAQAQQSVAQTLGKKGIVASDSSLAIAGAAAGLLGADIGSTVGTVAAIGDAFGGGKALSNALAFGLNAMGFPNIESIIWNAQTEQENRGGVYTRQNPQRGLIADNDDEFTGSPSVPGGGGDDDPAGRWNALDLWLHSVDTTHKFGADINSPKAFSSLGLSPLFTAAIGFGVQAVTGGRVGFGISTGSPFGVGFVGGLNGGLGFTGVFSPSGRNVVVAASGPAAPRGVISGVVFGNGVQVRGGVSGGTGIGGGIPFGLGAGVGPGGPGTLGTQGGGNSFAARGSMNSAGAYPNGASGNGASLNVGGAPSSFAIAAVPGTLTPQGAIAGNLYIGPDGRQSAVNTTGITI